MLTPFAKRILAAIALILGTGLLVVAVVILTPTPAPADPKITWAPSSLTAEVGRGESKTIGVSFISSEAVANVQASVVPALQSFVQVTPASFASMTAGQTLVLNVTISAGASSPLGTFNGTIQLRQRNALAKPLPIQLLVTVVPLPPDPGDAGKTTLAGIDSDGDGVRDDVQRYIALNYPSSERTRAALTQYAVTVQDGLALANSRNDSRAHAVLVSKAIECLSYIIGTNDVLEEVQKLRSQLVNTPLRAKAYIRRTGHISGLIIEGTPQSKWKETCSFDPDALRD